MSKITNEMVHYCYEIGKKVYYEKMTHPEGKEEIKSQTSMNIGSANDYINVLNSMLAGKEYHRTINHYATNYYLDNIRLEFGDVYYLNALTAVKLHEKYYGTLGYGAQTGLEKMVEERLAEINKPINPENCPMCGKKVSEIANFCRKCGYDLYSKPLMKCHNCGNVVIKDTFCYICGTML